VKEPMLSRRTFAKTGVGALLAAASVPRWSLAADGQGPKYQVGMKSKPPARRMTVFRLEDLPYNVRDLALTLHCLQGLVNRSQPRLYIVQDRYDDLWLKWLQERGDIDEVRYLDVAELFDEFLAVASCMYVTDPAIPASVNVATMLAGIHDGLVVTPDMAAMFRLPRGAYPDSYKVGADLRVMHWKKDVDAYRWAFEQFGQQLTKRAVAILDPQTTAIRDYFVEFKIPILWISNPEEQTVPRQSFAEERDFVREIFMRWPPNIPCMGWPLDKPGIGEWEGVRLFSECAKFEVCSGNDGYSPTVSNLSVHSGTTAALRQKASPPPPVLERDKVYFAFTRSDGDGLNFQRHYYRKLFDDPQHGDVPIGWQIGATASDLNPGILDYYYKHARTGDCFINALTGVGYIHEDSYADNYPAAQREEIWKEYLAISSEYRARIDASVMATFAEMQPQRLARFAAMDGIKGLFINYGTTSITTAQNEVSRVSGKPVFRAIAGGTTEYTFTSVGRRHAVEAMLDEIRRFTPRTRPAFMHVFLANWLSHMEMADEIAAGLGADYVPVRPDQLVALYNVAEP
jgi:hypothetical protein